MSSLPDDVSLIIFSHTHIDTFLNLRLLNHDVHNLINTHIRGLTEAVARSTFPRQSRILATSHELRTANAAACVQWLKRLRYYQLAAIMLECRESQMISAEDPFGDLLRDRLAEAWQVLQRFCDISHDVKSLSLGDLPTRVSPHTDNVLMDPQNSGHSVYEVEICSRRMAYLDTLPLGVIRAYKSLRVELISMLFGKQIPPLPNADGNYDVITVLHDRDVLPWISYHLAELGAEYFWQRWWGCPSASHESPNQVGHDLTVMWLNQDISERAFIAHGIICINRQVRVIISRSLRVTQQQVMTTSALGAPQAAGTSADMTRRFTDIRRRKALERTLLTINGVEAPPMVLAGIAVESKLDWETFGRVIERHTQTEALEFLRGRRYPRPNSESRDPEWLP